MSEVIRTRIIDLAERELGTVEHPNGSNIVKYNDWYYPEGHTYFKNPKPFAWCGTFVSYIYCGAQFQMPTIDTELGVHYIPTLATMSKAKHWTTTEPKKGDLVLFDWEKDGLANHIGIFVDWIEKGKSFSAIEGNTSKGEKGSQSNGDGVYKRVRYVGSVLMFVNLIDNIR